MDLWLLKPPKFTTFRVNNLKEFNLKEIKLLLKMQQAELEVDTIPNLYLLKNDCLILEQWPEGISFEKTGKEVIVDSACAAAVLRGSHVFAPGVLGLDPSCKLNERVDIYGDLEGHCKRGLKQRYEGNKIFVGSGSLKMTRHELYDNGVQPSGIAVITLMPTSRLPVISDNLFPNGELLLQNLPSIVCGWVVNAQPEEKILDMCAAPGNKTTHMAEMSNNNACIIAIDKTQPKVEKIKQNCERQGVTCVKSYVFDSTRCCLESASKELNGPPFPPDSFDKILLDAPCSGLGQRPQLVSKMNPKTIDSYKYLQRKLFTAAVSLLKVGGELIYSTCTIKSNENEGMVAWALEKFKNLELCPAEPLLGGPGLKDYELNDTERAMVQRFGPEEDDLRQVDDIYKDTIGFFIAKFRKHSN